MLTPMFPPIGVCIFAGLGEPEHPRDVETLVLRLLALRDGALGHADLEVTSLLAEEFRSLASLSCPRVLGRARTAVVAQLGSRLDPVLRRVYRLHAVRRQILRERFVIAGINEVVQRLTQQLVLQHAISKLRVTAGFEISISKFKAASRHWTGQPWLIIGCIYTNKYYLLLQCRNIIAQ